MTGWLIALSKFPILLLFINVHSPHLVANPWRRPVYPTQSTPASKKKKKNRATCRETGYQTISANWLDMALYNDRAPSTSQYSAKAVSTIFSTISGDNDLESSPPRLYKASEQIALFSSNVKGTNGSTVVVRDNIEA